MDILEKMEKAAKMPTPPALWCAEAADAIRRLRASLAICAADYVSPPCTVGQGAAYLGKEFERRAYVARDALQAD